MNKDSLDTKRGAARKLACVLACFLSASAAPGIGRMAGHGREAFVEGVKLLRLGRAKAALAKLLEAEKAYGENEAPPALLADIALAAQQGGDAATAEAYAERAAARDAGFAFMRDMLVGAARYAEARAALQTGGPELKKGLEKVDRAISSFERALMEQPASPEARRNLERGLKLAKELEDKLKEEEKKKKDENKEDKKEDKKEKKEKKEEEKKQEEEKKKKKSDKQKEKDKEKKKDKKESKKKGQAKKKPQPEQQGKKKGKPKEQKAKPKPMQLSKEDKKRLLEKLEAQLKKLQLLKARKRPRHVPGKKDW